MLRFAVTALIALLAPVSALATTLTYSGTILTDAEYAWRVLDGVNYGDADSLADQGFERRDNVQLQIIIPDTLLANERYVYWSGSASDTLKASFVSPEVPGGISLLQHRYASVWGFALETDSGGALGTWHFRYWTDHSSDRVNFSISDQGDDIFAELEKAKWDDGNYVCCEGFDRPLIGGYDVGTWQVDSQVKVVNTPLPASSLLVLGGLAILGGLKWRRSATGTNRQ